MDEKKKDIDKNVKESSEPKWNNVMFIDKDGKEVQVYSLEDVIEQKVREEIEKTMEERIKANLEEWAKISATESRRKLNEDNDKSNNHFHIESSSWDEIFDDNSWYSKDREYKVVNNLKQVIRMRGVTQNWLADMVGTSLKNLSDIVSNKTNPTITLVMKICRVLNVSVEDVFKLVENENE